MQGEALFGNLIEFTESYIRHIERHWHLKHRFTTLNESSVVVSKLIFLDCDSHEQRRGQYMWSAIQDAGSRRRGRCLGACIRPRSLPLAKFTALCTPVQRHQSSVSIIVKRHV